MEVLRLGYVIPFTSQPPLSSIPISFSSYALGSPKEIALDLEVNAMLQKGALEVSPQGPGFYSLLFGVKKPDGRCRPVVSQPVRSQDSI